MDKRLKIALGAGVLLFAPIALLGVEAYLATRGVPEPFQNPSPAPREFGTSGPKFVYVVLGDSTAAGQGAAYDKGIAVQTARHLATPSPPRFWRSIRRRASS